MDSVDMCVRIVRDYEMRMRSNAVNAGRALVAETFAALHEAGTYLWSPVTRMDRRLYYWA